MSTLPELKLKWLDAKRREKQANDDRREVEGEIYMLVEKDLKDSGTNNIGEGIKITTGYTEKWDQDIIIELNNNWTSQAFFPFKTEFKKDSAALKVLKERDTDAYLLVTKALSVTPAKPSFEIKE